MKKIFGYFAFMFFALAIISCSDNNPTGPNNGGGLGGGTGGPGGGGGGAVTFTITSEQTQNGTTFFASPSANVKITQVTVSLPAQQFNDVVQGDGATVYNANQSVSISEYTGVASGQQWTFQFQGSLADGNQTFTVTSNYTVP